MINLNEVFPIEEEGIVGFVCDGSVYFHLHDAMKLIDLHNSDRNCSSFNWRITHYLFYQAMSLLHIERKDYQLPLNHEPIKRSGPKTNYQEDLPEYIKDVILLKMANMRNGREKFVPAVKYYIALFKSLKSMHKAENQYKQNKWTPVSTYFKGEDNLSQITNNNIQKEDNWTRVSNYLSKGEDNMKDKEENNWTHVSNYLSENNNLPQTTNCSVNIISCQLNTGKIDGFIKDGDIFLNTIETGFMLGITNTAKYNGKIKIIVKWDRYYRYYLAALSYLGEDPETYTGGFNLMNSTNKAGAHSEYQQKMPEFLPILVVFGIAVNCHNSEAYGFKMDLTRTILPFFLNNASDAERRKVQLLGKLDPLFEESRKQNEGYVINPNSIKPIVTEPVQIPQINPLYGYNPNLSLQAMQRQMEIEYYMAHQQEHQKALEQQQGNLKSPISFGNTMNEEEYNEYIKKISKRF